MIKIKHSKYKNTGLIYELLVRQIAADTVSKTSSPAIPILKKYFNNKSPLAVEMKLYDFISKNKGVGQQKAETVLSTIIEISKKLDTNSLKTAKYNLIKDLREAYDIDEFFSIKIRDYKPFAALYCLLEAHQNADFVDPNVLVDNKLTILEHLSNSNATKADAKDALIEEYSKYDKDLRLLTYKILLEKFNSKYENLLPQQKRILREFITSASSTVRLRDFLNEEIANIKKEVESKVASVENEVVRIKLQEVFKSIKEIKKTEAVKDSHLANLMRYYDLVAELNNI